MTWKLRYLLRCKNCHFDGLLKANKLLSPFSILETQHTIFTRLAQFPHCSKALYVIQFNEYCIGEKLIHQSRSGLRTVALKQICFKKIDGVCLTYLYPTSLDIMLSYQVLSEGTESENVRWNWIIHNIEKYVPMRTKKLEKTICKKTKVVSTRNHSAKLRCFTGHWLINRICYML